MNQNLKLKIIDRIFVTFFQYLCFREKLTLFFFILLKRDELNRLHASLFGVVWFFLNAYH